MKTSFRHLSFIIAMLIVGCEPPAKRDASPPPTVSNTSTNISVKPNSIQKVADQRLGNVTSVDITIQSNHNIPQQPKLLACNITDEKGRAYRVFEFPNGRGGTIKTAIYVRGLEPFEYTPKANITFHVLFPLDQIPADGGAVYMDGILEIEQKKEAFRVKLR